MLRPKVVSLGSAFLDSGRIEEVIQPILREIVAESGDSASLGVLEDKDVLYVANFSARRFVRMTAGVGSRFPAYAVSMGRILLAALPRSEEHTSELQSLMRSSYAVFCLKKNK